MVLGLPTKLRPGAKSQHKARSEIDGNQIERGREYVERDIEAEGPERDAYEAYKRGKLPEQQEERRRRQAQTRQAQQAQQAQQGTQVKPMTKTPQARAQSRSRIATPIPDIPTFPQSPFTISRRPAPAPVYYQPAPIPHTEYEPVYEPEPEPYVLDQNTKHQPAPEPEPEPMQDEPPRQAPNPQRRNMLFGTPQARVDMAIIGRPAMPAGNTDRLHKFLFGTRTGTSNRTKSSRKAKTKPKRLF